MSKRSYGDTPSRKKSRTYSVTGYDRSKGGVQHGGLQAYRSRVTVQAAARALGRITEIKGVDTALTIAGPITSATNTNGDVFVLNLVQTGSGSWNRIGRKINLLSVRLRGLVTWTYTNAATTGNIQANTLRMVLVWDKQPSGAAIPTFDSIFGKTDQSGTESTTFLDAPKYDNMDRFKIVKDCVVPFVPKTFNGAAGTTDLVQEQWVFDEFISLGNREVVFSGQSAPMTIADISTGALYVYFRAAGATDDVNDLAISSVSFARLRYKDS